MQTFTTSKPSRPGIPGVTQIIAIASGKGGVGKSTVTANLACAMQQLGLRVGVLDADIYGPSQPQILGASSKPKVGEDQRLQPVICHGIQTMSIGYLVETETAMIWRGPMVTKALQQMAYETAWDKLDFLLFDLPPGTGDIQLTMAQKIPVTAAVIVTTPQDIALADVRRAIAMFNKVKIPIQGVIENMALHTCSHCGHEDAIFGEGGGERLAQEFSLSLLGSLPLMRDIQQQGERGIPIALAQPDSVAARVYLRIAEQLKAVLPAPKTKKINIPLVVRSTEDVD